MNVTTMICRLTKDVELRYSQGSSNLAIAKFSVACDREFKKEGEPTADFYNCIAFGKVAETLEKYAGTKGVQIGLEGRFQNNNYTDKNGNKHYDFQFVVNKITFLGRKNESNGGVGSRQAPQPTPNGFDDSFMRIPDGVDDEELPFN
jgi:single-strand DNA-binding protein